MLNYAHQFNKIRLLFPHALSLNAPNFYFISETSNHYLFAVEVQKNLSSRIFSRERPPRMLSSANKFFSPFIPLSLCVFSTSWASRIGWQFSECIVFLWLKILLLGKGPGGECWRCSVARAPAQQAFHVVRTFEDLTKYVQNNELTERRNLDEPERPIATNAGFEIKI